MKSFELPDFICPDKKRKVKREKKKYGICSSIIVTSGNKKHGNCIWKKNENDMKYLCYNFDVSTKRRCSFIAKFKLSVFDIRVNDL